LSSGTGLAPAYFVTIDVKALMDELESRRADILNQGTDLALDREAAQRKRIGAQIAAVAKEAAQLPRGTGMSAHVRALIGGESAEISPSMIFGVPPSKV
jgi:hypothetical protein